MRACAGGRAGVCVFACVSCGRAGGRADELRAGACACGRAGARARVGVDVGVGVGVDVCVCVCARVCVCVWVRELCCPLCCVVFVRFVRGRVFFSVCFRLA